MSNSNNTPDGTPDGTNPANWHFDPETGQPVQPETPQSPAQPYVPPQPQQQPAYTPPTPAEAQGYSPPSADPNAPGGYRVQEPYTPPPAIMPEPVQPTQPVHPPQPYTPAPQVNVNTVPAKGGRGGLVGGIIALAVLAVLGGGAFLAWNLINNTVNRPTVAVERLLPANALGYFTISPNLTGSQKDAMDKMRDAFESQPGFKEAWANLTKSATDATNRGGSGGPCAGSSSSGTPGAPGTPDVGDFSALSNYLGNNITVAMLPPSADDLQKLKSSSENGDTQQVAGDVLGRNVIGIVDLDFNPLNKKGPITDLKKQADNAGKLELAETYKGTDIRKYNYCSNTVYFALLDNSSTAIIGAKVEPLRAVLDQYKGATSSAGGTGGTGLKDDATFKALSGQVPSDRIASFYLNLTQIYKEIGFVSPDSAKSVQNVTGAMLMTLSAHDDGMQLDVASQADFANSLMGQNGTIQINPNAKPDAATLSDIPAGSLGFLVGTDLKSVIQSALDTMRKQGGDMADQIKAGEDQIKQTTGKDLETEILPLLGGDYVLSATLGKDASSGSPIADIAFQLKLKSGDRDKMLQVIDSATQKSSSDTPPTKFDAAGGTFYTLQPNNNGSPILGVTGDRLLFIAPTDNQPARANLDTITAGFGKGVGSTDEWRATAKHLPADSNVIGYLDLAKVRTAVENGMLQGSMQEYNTKAAPLVRPFKYLLMGSATQPNREGNLSRNHTVLFVGIGK